MNGFKYAAGAVVNSNNIYQVVDNVISRTKQYIDENK